MPLTAEQRRWAEKKIAEGASREEVFMFLASKKPSAAGGGRDSTSQVENANLTHEQAYGPQSTSSVGSKYMAPSHEPRVVSKSSGTSSPQKPLQESGPTGRQLLEIARQNAPRVGKFLGRKVAEEGGKMALSMAAGRGAAMLPLPPWLKVPAVLLAEGAGQTGGELGRQWVRQRIDPNERMDVGRAVKEGGFVVGAGGLMAGVGAGLSRMGGVSGPAIGQAVLRPSEIMRKPTRQDYWQLFKDVGKSFREQGTIKTEGRQAMESLMGQAGQQGRMIRGSEFVNAVLRQIKGGSEKGLVAADREMYQLAGRLQAEIDRIAPGGWLSPQQFDELLRTNFTTRVQEWSARPGGAIYANRLEAARNELAEHFYKEIGPEMGEAAQRSASMLNLRETAENLLPMGTNLSPALGTANKIRGAASETNIGGLGIQETLAAYDAKYGTDFARRLSDLHLSEEFYPLGSTAAAEIPIFASVGRAPKNIVEAAARSLGAMLLKRGATNPKLRSLGTSLLFDIASRNPQPSQNGR